MSILMSLFSPSSRLQDSVLTPEIATYCSFYFLISYHFYDDDLGENSSLLLDSNSLLIQDFFFYFDLCFSGNISQ